MKGDYCLVQYDNHESAQKAVAEMDKQSVEGHTVEVSLFNG